MKKLNKMCTSKEITLDFKDFSCALENRNWIHRAFKKFIG